MNPLSQNISAIRDYLAEGHVIPALPLALDNNRQWTQRHQKAVLRYYFEAGTGGLAVGVHSTQFEIRDPEHALFEPVLKMASEEMAKLSSNANKPYIQIAGLCGKTDQAVKEAEFAHRHGYHAGLLSLAAMKDASINDMIRHCEAVSEIIPIIGFYLQPAVGGKVLPYEFWKKFCGIPNVVAIKMAPFNRYQTGDVVRAVMETDRYDIHLYTGNDDNIINDLLTPWSYAGKKRFIVGGLLGQWGVWTQKAVQLLEEIKKARQQATIPIELLQKNAELTDANGVVFDAANKFAGCLPGIHEVLRRNGLLPTVHCLNPHEVLSPGQSEELDRVAAAYPWLTDDEFIARNRERWLAN